MRDWEKKRNDEVSEHVLVTHIVCLLLFLMIVFIYFDLPLGPIPINSPSVSIIMVTFCLFTVLYISRNILSKIPILSQARIEEVLLLVILFPLTFAFVWYSKDFMVAKMLIIVPVIITTTAFGKLPGLGAAALSSTLLFLIDYKLFPTCPPDIFQSSLIVSSIAIILAWLVGGLLKAERETQRDLIKLADYEQLTGLYNHRYLHEKLTLSIQDAVIKKTPLSLALLDIDQFKFFVACFLVSIDVNVIGTIIRYQSNVFLAFKFEYAHDFTFHFLSVIKFKCQVICVFF
jgi:predicted signal transduction protein with EAL and GGDEF domain